jgi:hypothetical protein
MIHYMMPLVLIAAPWALALGPAPAEQDGDPIDKLIADLGDDRVWVRESALQAIIASGPQAIPRLRDAQKSQDAEVQERAACALGELERAQKLAAVMQARPPVTLDLKGATFTRALEVIAGQTGLQFDGAVAPPERPITLSFTRAPLMQVLDALAAEAGLQWLFDSETTVSWRKNPPVLRPSCYQGGFKASLSRIDVYKSWDYQQGHGLMWVYLETRMEPGIRPIGAPRFEVSEIRDDAGNELPRDSETQECSPKGYPSEGVGRKSGAVYESSPFTINQLDRSVKKLSKISGRAIFLFPLEKTTLEITDLCEETSITHGDLVFQVNEILTSSVRLTLTSSGDLAQLSHHVDPDSLVLVDADGREYVRGTDFDVRVDQMSADTLRYCVDFNESVAFQPVAIRFVTTGQFFEKVVPFEFKDIPLP